MKPHVDLRVPPAAEYANLAAFVARDAATRARLEEQQCAAIADAARLAFELIVREAMASEREPIRLHSEITPEELVVTLTERGLPLDDAAARRDPSWQQIIERVDNARWILHGRAGSELRLGVVRPHGIAGGAAEPVPEERVPLAPEQTYTVRRFQPEDGPGVARAFFQTWGYRYLLPFVYVPQRLAALNASNEYISIVAVAENGEVAGHYALDPVPGTPIADGCSAIVSPAHRGRGLLERMRAEAEAQAVQLDLAAYYTEPVTAHGRTQSDSIKFGAKLCGIVLGRNSAAFVPKAIQAAAAGQRQSITIYYKPLKPRESRAIYAPPKHRAMIETIYAQLGLPVGIREGSAPAGEGELHISVLRIDAFALIDVVHIGSASADQLAQAVSDLRALGRIEAVNLRLPLEDPAAPQLCAVAERLGFFFCGVTPWALGGGDALRLQLPLKPVAIDDLVVVSDFGEQLRAYIAGSRQTPDGTSAQR